MSRSDMDLLLDDGIKTAIHFLEKRGEFFPFAVAKTSGGDTRHIQALMDDDRPSSTDVRDFITSKLREEAKAGLYTAAAIVTSTQLTDQVTGSKSDAIRVEIDDVESDPVTCYLPYELREGRIQLGDVKATNGARFAFLR